MEEALWTGCQYLIGEVADCPLPHHPNMRHTSVCSGLAFLATRFASHSETSGRRKMRTDLVSLAGWGRTGGEGFCASAAVLSRADLK